MIHKELVVFSFNMLYHIRKMIDFYATYCHFCRSVCLFLCEEETGDGDSGTSIISHTVADSSMAPFGLLKLDWKILFWLKYCERKNIVPAEKRSRTSQI